MEKNEKSIDLNVEEVKKAEQIKGMAFNQMIDEIHHDIEKSIEEDEKFTKEYGNARLKTENKIMNRIFWSIFNKLFGSFKLKVTLYYKDKVVFEYEIPKE